MAAPAPYPLLLKPAYQDYIWGGKTIRERFHPEAPEGLVAEAWEVSDRTDGMPGVRNWPMEGKTFAEVRAAWGNELVRGVDDAAFPLLIKVLDAAKTLSLQVHPHDGNAAELEGEAKSEMWYILDAEPDACVYLGFQRDVVEDEVKAAISGGTLESLLTRRPVKKGELVFVPGGTVHAIGAGCLILEIQQNSNTTYRLYDWGRTGADGKPRALHVDQGMRAMDRTQTDPALFPVPEVVHEGGGWKEERLLDAPWFRFHRITGMLGEGHSFGSDDVEVLFCAAGSLRLHAPGTHETLVPGSTVVIPAGMQDYRLQSSSEELEVLRIFAGPDTADSAGE